MKKPKFLKIYFDDVDTIGNRTAFKEQHYLMEKLEDVAHLHGKQKDETYYKIEVLDIECVDKIMTIENEQQSQKQIIGRKLKLKIEFSQLNTALRNIKRKLEKAE